MKIATVVSAGGVIFRISGDKVEVAITARDSGKIWSLPKGLVEKGESLEDAALREVSEETGLTGKLMRKIDTIDYWFYWRPKEVRFHKFVHFFLLEHIGGDIAKHDWEVDEVRWFPIDDAVEKLTYKSEREVLEKAKKLIVELTR
ncbi:MAG: NUDIX hydrolase [Actinomycetota bacterium]|nr:NUDIX hydrolase [Actinomycetota bacterium]